MSPWRLGAGHGGRGGGAQPPVGPGVGGAVVAPVRILVDSAHLL